MLLFLKCDEEVGEESMRREEVGSEGGGLDIRVWPYINFEEVAPAVTRIAQVDTSLEARRMVRMHKGGKIKLVCPVTGLAGS